MGDLNLDEDIIAYESTERERKAEETEGGGKNWNREPMKGRV